MMLNVATFLPNYITLMNNLDGVNHWDIEKIKNNINLND
jgi:hypothetical protein